MLASVRAMILYELVVCSIHHDNEHQNRQSYFLTMVDLYCTLYLICVQLSLRQCCSCAVEHQYV